MGDSIPIISHQSENQPDSRYSVGSIISHCWLVTDVGRWLRIKYGARLVLRGQKLGRGASAEGGSRPSCRRVCAKECGVKSTQTTTKSRAAPPTSFGRMIKMINAPLWTRLSDFIIDRMVKNRLHAADLSSLLRIRSLKYGPT
eukprot:1695191-Pleurochrysis_carterae.AAC.1